MPPKQDSNSDRITALEGQFGGLTSVIEKLCVDLKANHQLVIEMEKSAEERHRQAQEEKQSRVETAATSKPDIPRSAKNSAEETPSPISDGPQPQTQGLQLRPEKGVLSAPANVIPLRSAETHTTPFSAGSSGYSPQQKSSPVKKQLELPEFTGKNPDDWIFRVEKCFSVNQTEEDEKLTLAMACLEGCAVTWLRMIQVRDELLDWRDFKMKVRKRFKPSRGGTILR